MNKENTKIPKKVTDFYEKCSEIVGRYEGDTFYDSLGHDPGKLETREVIVECDSQEFHERTERERRYEKARDRFLISRGYTVFHFTGKEILTEPFRVAAEIIHFLATGWEVEEILETISEYSQK